MTKSGFQLEQKFTAQLITVGDLHLLSEKLKQLGIADDELLCPRENQIEQLFPNVKGLGKFIDAYGVSRGIEIWICRHMPFDEEKEKRGTVGPIETYRNGC